MLHPANAGGIQTISNRKVVRHRHLCDQGLHISARISAGPDGIAIEHAERRKRAGRASRRHGVAIQINGRIAGNCITALRSWKISEDALPCLRRQDRTCDVSALGGTIALEQEKEKCLVLNDRPTDASTILVPILVILSRPVKVIAPCIGV